MLNRKIKLDLAILAVSAAVIVLILQRMPFGSWRTGLLSGMLLLALAVFGVLVYDLMYEHYRQQDAAHEGLPLGGGASDITRICLLNEYGDAVRSWDIVGKVALVIGRDVRENAVDIDLGDTQYASLIDVEHAVMNYSSHAWYVEDIGSKNGLSVRKQADGRLYRLAADVPCRVERGDVLMLGMTRLELA